MSTYPQIMNCLPRADKTKVRDVMLCKEPFHLHLRAGEQTALIVSIAKTNQYPSISGLHAFPEGSNLSRDSKWWSYERFTDDICKSMLRFSIFSKGTKC